MNTTPTGNFRLLIVAIIVAAVMISATLFVALGNTVTKMSTSTVSITITSPVDSPVEVASVTGPIPPYNPGGPVISIVLKNIGDTPIVSLNATLVLPGPTGSYPFTFDISTANPLLPGHSVSSTHTLIGAGFSSELDYTLMINGTLSDGARLSYTQQVAITAPG